MIQLIVGLGNPGKEYEKTRHNIGEQILEGYAAKRDLTFSSWRSHQVAKDRSDVASIHLFIDSAYMNLAGGPLQEFAAFHKIEPKDMLIVHDELDLPFGRIQLKYGGSSGGHNGVASIIETLGTDQFWRCRIGIGRPATPEQAASYVLSTFSQTEADQLPTIVDETVTLLINSIEKQPIAVSKTVIFSS